VSPAPVALPGPARRGHYRLPSRRGPSAGTVVRRRWINAILKRVLPLLAVGLLVLLAIWPEIMRGADSARVSFRRVVGTAADGATLIEARYRGTDEAGRPFTITASTVDQGSEQRVLLGSPRADLTTDGAWVLIEARRGVFVQNTNVVDLQDDVTIWHDNGMRLETPSATLDLRAGSAAGAEPVAAQGDFGTIESEGFTLLDRGAVIVFQGRARLMLEGRP
jgi:lipopolysaccharide export system protein LptC